MLRLRRLEACDAIVCIDGAPKESRTSAGAGGAPLNYEKAAPSSLEQSCGQGMNVAPYCHGRLYSSALLSLLSVSKAVLFLSCLVR